MLIQTVVSQEGGLFCGSDMPMDGGLCLCFEQLLLKIAEGRRRKQILKVLHK